MTSARAHRCALRVAAFLPVRAHLPFVPPASAPVYFRRGDRSPVGNHCDLQKQSAGDGVASTSGLRLPSAVRLLGTRSAGETRPALGFASCRVIGHLSPCIGRARPRLPIIRLRNIAAPHLLTRDDSYPLMGFGDDPSHHARLAMRRKLLRRLADRLRDCEELSLRAMRRCPSAS